MFVNPGFGIFASLLTGVGACFCVVTLDSQPWLSQSEIKVVREQREKMWLVEAQRTVFGMVPAGVRTCGFVALGADRSAALKCVEHAERDQAPYWVASQAHGFDSHVWIVVLEGDDGASELLLDSYGWETDKPRRPRFAVTKLPCKAINKHAAVKVRISEGDSIYEPAFDCGR